MNLIQLLKIFLLILFFFVRSTSVISWAYSYVWCLLDGPWWHHVPLPWQGHLLFLLRKDIWSEQGDWGGWKPAWPARAWERGLWTPAHLHSLSQQPEVSLGAGEGHPRRRQPAPSVHQFANWWQESDKLQLLRVLTTAQVRN